MRQSRNGERTRYKWLWAFWHVSRRNQPSFEYKCLFAHTSHLTRHFSNCLPIKINRQFPPQDNAYSWILWIFNLRFNICKHNNNYCFMAVFFECGKSRPICFVSTLTIKIFDVCLFFFSFVYLLVLIVYIRRYICSIHRFLPCIWNWDVICYDALHYLKITKHWLIHLYGILTNLFIWVAFI